MDQKLEMNQTSDIEVVERILIKKKKSSLAKEWLTKEEEDSTVEELSGTKHRSYAFTYYPKLRVAKKADDDEIEDFKKLLLKMKPRYYIFQHEVCPKTDKDHFQGTIIFTNQRHFNAVRKGLNYSHIEPCRSEGASANYCRKSETSIAGPWEWGDMPEQGKRCDIIALKDAILSGNSEWTVATDDKLLGTYAKYTRYSDRLYELKLKKFSNSFRKVEVDVLWGEAGSGKTKSVYEKYGFENIYNVTNINDKVWFDGYNGESILLLDDFYGWIQWGYFLKITDGYPIRLDVKTRSSWACWTRVIITSNKHPIEWYPNKLVNGKLSDEFVRRLSSVSHMRRQVSDKNVGSEVACNTIEATTDVDEHMRRIRAELEEGKPKKSDDFELGFGYEKE